MYLHWFLYGDKCKYIDVRNPWVSLTYLQTGISGVFSWVLSLENLNFLGYWSQLLYSFGLLNKSCILKCFICSTVFLGPVLFAKCFNNHGSPLLSYRA